MVLKLLLLGLVALVLVPAVRQVSIDGYQQAQSTAYAATVDISTFRNDCSCYNLTFTVNSTGQVATLLTKDQFNATQAVTVVYHPAFLWGNAYWEVQS